MIKILFFIPTLGHGGAERVLINLVNHMDKKTFDITVQTMFDVGIYKNKLNKDIKYKGGFPWYFRGNTYIFKLFSPKFLYKIYIKENYDIIVSFLEGPSARVISGCNKNTKLISWIHTEHPNNKYVCSVFRSMNEAKKSYCKYNKIICVAETVKQNFYEIFKLNVPTEVLYNVVETNEIKNLSYNKIDDIIFNKNEINLCSVAKLTSSKGYDRLIPIISELRNDGIPVHLYLIGKGEEENKLRKLSKKYNVFENITFVGFRKNPYKYVAASDLYICSSYREGFSTSVTESLIVGTPVVSTNCSGAKELLGYNNEYGIVTENNEKHLYEGIKKMLTEDGLLEHYRIEAKKRGERFEINSTVYAVENMFKGV